MKKIIYVCILFAFILSAGTEIYAQKSMMAKGKIQGAEINPIKIDIDVAFISDLKYGLFSHYVSAGCGGTTGQNGVPSKSIQEQINTFDADQIKN